MNINAALNELLEVEGATAAAVVDYKTGMMLGSAGTGIDLEIAAAGNTEVVRAKLKTMQMLGLDEKIEDILITLNTQYHMIRPLEREEDLFIYYVLGSAKSNLALARRKLKKVESELQVD